MSRRAALGVVVALGALAACSVLPSPEPPRYEYVVLTAVTASPPAGAGAGAAVAIDRIRLPAYLERAELVTRVSDNRLEFSPRARWAEPLQVAVPRVLSEALAAAAVHVVERGDPATELTLDLAIDQLERTASGPARLRARWWLHRARRPAGANQLTADEPLPPGASSDAIAAALSRLLVRLSAAIAADVRG